MGDMGDDFNAYKAMRKEKKKSNLEASTQILTEAGIAFISKNCGTHLIVRGLDELIDFWPSTGKFIRRSNGRPGRGVRNLIRICGEDK